MRLLVLALLAVVAVSGCTSASPPYQFGGTFRESATASDLQDFEARMKRWGAQDVIVMESFPMQFQVRGLGEDCEGARIEATSLPYVHSASGCRQTTDVRNPDSPTSAAP
jgi:hypothetical protein